MAELDAWLRKHNGSSCVHAEPARVSWKASHPNEPEPWVLIDSGRCDARGGRLMKESECREYSEAEGLHFIGSTVERAEYPGCVIWEGVRAEFNAHSDQSAGCAFGKRAR